MTTPNSKSVSSYPVPAQAQQSTKEPFIITPMRIREALFSLDPYDSHTYGYLERHLIGWQNDELVISADEILHGRRKASGGRYDNGLPQIKSKARVLRSIRNLARAGLIIIKNILARGIHVIELAQRSLYERIVHQMNGDKEPVKKEDNRPPVTVHVDYTTVHHVNGTEHHVNGDNQTARLAAPLPERREETPSVEPINTSINTLINTKDVYAPTPTDEASVTSLAADAALESVEFVSEEDELRREIAILKAEEDELKARILKPWSETKRMMQIGAMRMGLESKLERLLSGSQVPTNAPDTARSEDLPRAGLQEADEQEETPERTLDEWQQRLDDLTTEANRLFLARNDVFGTPAYDQVMRRLQAVRNEQQECRAAIRKLEPPEDEPPTDTLFGDLEPPPAPIEMQPKNNFQAAAFALNIPLGADLPHKTHGMLSAIAKFLSEHVTKKPEQALEFLRELLKQERWIKEPGGLLKVLTTNYAGGVA